MDIRCENGKKFGEVREGILEVRCRSRQCGYEPGVVVLHQFRLSTGEHVDTRRFRDPVQKENS